MREMMEQAKEREVVLVDGVKVIHDDGWALVLPDPEEPDSPTCWAEGPDETTRRRLAEDYARPHRRP